MALRRRKPVHARDLTNGPGKLTQALAITGADYGRDLCGPILYLEDSGMQARQNRLLNANQRGLRRRSGPRSDGAFMSAATATYRCRRATEGARFGDFSNFRKA